MVKKNLTKVAALGMISAMAVTSMFGCSKDDKDPTKATNAGDDNKPVSGEKTEINVYAFTKEVPNMFNKYVSTHPDFAAKYKLKFTQVTTDPRARYEDHSRRRV